MYTPATLAAILSDYWDVVSRNTGLSLNRIALQSLIAPARCMLSDTSQIGTTNKKVDEHQLLSSSEEKIVEKAFAFLPELSQILRDKYGV